MFKQTVIVFALLISSMSTSAAPSINEMQECQAVIHFVEQKLSSPPEIYPADHVQNVLIGLKAYDHYIQKEIISPGLLSFNQGDTAKAEAMQSQIDSYKQTLVNNLNRQHPQNRLFTDHALMINNCTNKAVPSGEALSQLKTALETMVQLAQRN